ncbi:MAG: hypothetical protein AVDCRST_MAG68-1801 [uncultured Gemmatimonadetes bacterium]|uniref:Uncharacterized protein n=1 Tax=uncultured Gemmatimonadota bacterium TaxID=203437 RepID=A0A6J4K495_9BACT|nr:MAG: hypothetical protein AVDCRST_MAG68-1801 [uncultured Gemmatimonadota bacterium]
MSYFDLSTILVLWIAGAVMIFPLAGIAARFGLVPVLHAVARVRRPGAEEDEALEERLAGVEGQLRALTAAVDRMGAR